MERGSNPVYDNGVEPQKSSPLEELKALDQAVAQTKDLNGLRPIFYRLDEIAQKYTEDVDVQLAIGDVKQHILSRGNALKERKNVRPAGLSAHPVPPLQDDSPTADRTSILPVPQVPRRAQDVPTVRPPSTVPPGPVGIPPVSNAGKHPGSHGMAWAMAVIGILAAIAIAVVVVRKWTPMVAMQIVTVPPGASVTVTGKPKVETKCVSDCSLNLPPGTYQIAMALDGYEPGVESATLELNHPAALNLNLQPLPQTVRIHSDLAQGRVIFDSMLPAAFENGEYTIEKVMPGRHTVKVAGAGGETSFSFDVAPAKQPGIMGTVEAHDVLTVLVASLANRARVVTSSGPWKLAVNGHTESDAGPAGVELDSLAPGDDELVIGEGDDRRSLKEHFGSDAALTVLVTTDPSAGTLIVSTGQNGARVFLNNSERALLTQAGELLVQVSGRVEVRVTKDGFEEPPPQIIEVKKGTKVRLDFKMVPLPR